MARRHAGLTPRRQGGALAVSALALSALTLSTLTACSSGSTGSSSSPSATSGGGRSVSAAPPTAPPLVAASTKAGPGGPSPSAEGKAGPPIAINKSAQSAPYGDSWTVLTLVRGFPVPKRLQAIQGSEIVLVRVKVTAGTKYATALGAGSFSMIDGTGRLATPIGAQLGPELKAAGFAPLLSDARRGASTTGWLAFRFDAPRAPKLVFRYHQLPAQIVSSGTTIPDAYLPITLVG